MTVATNNIAAAGTAILPVIRPEWFDFDVWPHRVRSLLFEDRTIAYTDVGSGPTLLFVHVGMWSFVWRDVIADLSTDFRCVAFDAPGTGLSTGDSKVDIEIAARATTALVEHLELESITLVFHDLGGPCVLHATSSWAERVDRLVAINTFGWRPTGVAFRSMLALMGSPVMREVDVLSGWLPRMTSSAFGVGRNLDRLGRRTFRRGMDHRGRRSFHRYMKSIRRHDFTTIDATVDALATRPLLTIFGEKNDPLGFQPQWAARFADITQVEVAGGNHFPMCDDPTLVSTAIRSWTLGAVDDIAER